ILLECEALLLPVATGPDGRQLLALPVLGLVEATVALAGSGGVPGVVHRLVLALFVVDPTELGARPRLDWGHLLRVALGLRLVVAVQALLLADLLFGLALDHAGIVVTAEDVGGAADVRPLRLRQARVLEGADLVHRLLEAIVGAV